MRAGRPPTLWWLDHVGIERALREEIGAADLLGLLVEHVDEGGADDLALLLGIRDARQAREEQFARVAVNQRDVVVAAEQAHHLLRLARAQQPVVDEDAGELVADGLVNQDGRDGGIDAARQAADDAALADLGADAFDGLGAEGRHRPFGLAARDAVGEGLEKVSAMRRVHHLGVEHGAVVVPFVVADQREGRAFAGAQHAEAFGHARHAVAVAHPHGLAAALPPGAVEERAVADQVDHGAAELTVVRALDLAAELMAHRLLAVADAKHGHTQFEHDLRRAWRMRFGHRGRAAGEDDGFGCEFAHALVTHAVGQDLAIDAAFAHAARDELGHLRAEIEAFTDRWEWEW
jgi:hypothetical protein